MIESFEQLKGTEGRDKLEHLLKLVIPEEDRDIYRRRYEENSRLLEQNPERQKEILQKCMIEPLDIKRINESKLSKNRIGREVFTGEDCVTGVEFSPELEDFFHSLEGEEIGITTHSWSEL